MMNPMNTKKVNTGGRPSRGRNGKRYNVNLRDEMREPLSQMTAVVTLREGRHVAMAEALEIVVAEWLAQEGHEVEL